MIRLGDLKRLLRERLLREEGENALPKETDDSLDAQVDRYLAQYEGEAKSSKTEGRDFRMLTRRILSEAEEDEEGGDEAEPPAKLTLEDIDIESFVNGVVRLIDNYDSLLEVRSTLARRAKNFLGKNYAPDVVEAFEQVLRDDHGIVAGKAEEDVEAEDFPAPGADRAGEGGAGGTPA
jgi:hypothetical protein